MSDASAAARLVAKLADLGLEGDEAQLLATVFRKAGAEGRVGALEAHSKPFKGSDEELQALVDWLLEQKAEG